MSFFNSWLLFLLTSVRISHLIYGSVECFLDFHCVKRTLPLLKQCFLYITEMLCFISNIKGNSKQWSRLCLFFIWFFSPSTRSPLKTLQNAFLSLYIKVLCHQKNNYNRCCERRMYWRNSRKITSLYEDICSEKYLNIFVHK